MFRHGETIAAAASGPRRGEMGHHCSSQTPPAPHPHLPPPAPIPAARAQDYSLCPLLGQPRRHWKQARPDPPAGGDLSPGTRKGHRPPSAPVPTPSLPRGPTSPRGHRPPAAPAHTPFSPPGPAPPQGGCSQNLQRSTHVSGQGKSPRKVPEESPMRTLARSALSANTHFPSVQFLLLAGHDGPRTPAPAPRKRPNPRDSTCSLTAQLFLASASAEWPSPGSKPERAAPLPAQGASSSLLRDSPPHSQPLSLGLLAGPRVSQRLPGPCPH